jgi:hypothetical protein
LNDGLEKSVDEHDPWKLSVIVRAWIEPCFSSLLTKI